MDTNLTVTQLGGDAEIGSQDQKDTTTSGQAGKAEQDVVAEVNTKYSKWRAERRPLEGTWFVNAALIRGQGDVKWNPFLQTLEQRKTPAHRSREQINMILPKVQAKLSKFLKTRAVPVVTAASTDHEDILNAQATTKVLEYLWQKLSLEEKYEEALLWAMQTGKAFWWFYWDDKQLAQVKEPEDEVVIGKPEVFDIPLGDVAVELGSAFEVLVSDPGVMRIQNQPEIMRVKTRMAKDVEAQYQLPPGTIKGELRESELFQYQRQIANLGGKNSLGVGTDRDKESATHVVVKELFTKPCTAYPEGRYVVVAGDKLLHQAKELPYGLATSNSPYPVVEFSDTLTAGQFWPTTMVEQLAPGQKQYNRLRNQLDEQLKLQTHPWIFYPKQAGIHKDAFGSEAGQKIPFNYIAGMPHPQQWIVRPEPIVQDVYQTLNLIRGEMDAQSNLYPASMGGAGGESGFDTNLLQEAADSVHAPNIRRNELALKDAAFKLRRIAKLGYDIPRLITIVGRDKQPDAFEYSQENIDEHANISIDTGSALPNMKHARIEAILKLDERQVFGPPGDPQRNRKLTKMLDLGSSQENADLVGVDEDHARLENLAFSRGEAVEDPMPWEDHDVEYEIHTYLLKSPEIKSWSPEQRAALVRHTILHVKWKNPQNALQLAAVFGMQDVVAEIQQTMMVQQSVAQQFAPAPQEQPQGGGQQPAAPPAQQAPPQA